ncbi:hypothetical protein ACRAWF_28325 [Streptomyces sp. L7]
MGSGAVGALAVLGGTAGCTARADGEAVSATAPAGGRVRGATAITKVYGDGQKLVAVAVEYDADITGSDLSTSTFKVTGRTVTKVYPNRSADLAERGRDGRYVIVEMSPDDKTAALWVTQQGGGTASSSSPTGSSGAAPGGGGPKVEDSTPGGTVTTTSGTRYPASATKVTTGAVKNLIVDDFRQFTFADPVTKQTLRYNLFVPKGYDPLKRASTRNGSTPPGSRWAR